MNTEARSQPVSKLRVFITVLTAGLVVSGCNSEPPFYVGDFESGTIQESLWRFHQEGECDIALVRAPVRGGKYAAEFNAGAGARCELLPWIGTTIFGRLHREPFGIERWYGFSVYLPSGWEPNERNEVIAQWHASSDRFFGERGARGPPLALRIHGASWRVSYGWERELLSDGKYKASRILWQGPYAAGRWTDWAFRVIWSEDDQGLTEVWVDGVKVAQYAGPNAYNDLRGVYLKIGDYHPGIPRTIYIDELRVGGASRGLAGVSPPPEVAPQSGPPE